MIDVFIAYAHNDLGLKNELKKFLAPLLREKRVSVWDDFDIEAGADWDAAIKQRLYAADLVLLLVSADSLASDYFYGKEVQVSLERHQRGEAVVVPVILRHCDWESTPLGDLEALPEKGRPVVKWPTHDEAFSDVVRRLRAVVGNLEAKRKAEGDEAEARRLFEAAVEAAEHLFQKEDWAEAARAYATAAGLHRAGFVPEKRVFEQQRTTCLSNAKSAELAQKATREAAEREQRAATEHARQQEMEMAWSLAQSANAPELYEHFAITFPGSPYVKAARQKAKELRRLLEKQDWQKTNVQEPYSAYPPPLHYPPQPNYSPPLPPVQERSGGGFIFLLVLVLVAGFGVWKLGCQRNPGPQQNPEKELKAPPPTDRPASGQTEEAAFNQAKTFRDWQQFLQQYPGSTRRATAEQEQRKVKKQVEDLVGEYRAYTGMDKHAKAVQKMQEALRLDPDSIVIKLTLLKK